MKITKKQLKQIIREAWMNYSQDPSEEALGAFEVLAERFPGLNQPVYKEAIIAKMEQHAAGGLNMSFTRSVMFALEAISEIKQ